MLTKEKYILDQYRQEKQNYLKLGEIVYDILENSIKETKIPINLIQYRVKEEKSLKGKLQRKGDRYQSVFDLTDILGARVICYFSDDIDRIGKIVEDAFDIDWEHSSDKRAALNIDSFGYLSLHYICSLKKDGKYEENLCDRRFEIQIRTILQHAWSDVNHDLWYKPEFGIPKAITRDFARLAGLLEIADDEFIRIRDTVNEYTEGVRLKVANDGADDVPLDSVSFTEYMKHNKKMQEFIKTLADIEGSEVTFVSPDQYIEQFKWLGANSIGDVQKMLAENSDLAEKLARKALEGTELDILSTTAALRFLCRAKLISGGYSKEQIEEFITISTRDKKRASRQAEHLIKTYEEIQKAE